MASPGYVPVLPHLFPGQVALILSSPSASARHMGRGYPWREPWMAGGGATEGRRRMSDRKVEGVLRERKRIRGRWSQKAEGVLEGRRALT